MHAQETLASAAALAGLTDSIPIEGERQRSRVGRPETTDGRAIQTEWARRVSPVQCVAEHAQIANALKRERGTPHTLELAWTERGARCIARHVIVTVVVQLRWRSVAGRGSAHAR